MTRLSLTNDISEDQGVSLGIHDNTLKQAPVIVNPRVVEVRVHDPDDGLHDLPVLKKPFSFDLKNGWAENRMKDKVQAVPAVGGCR